MLYKSTPSAPQAPYENRTFPAPSEITSSCAQQLSLAALVLPLIDSYFLATHLIFVSFMTTTYSCSSLACQPSRTLRFSQAGGCLPA